MDRDYERGILVVSMPEDKVTKSVNGELVGISPHRYILGSRFNLFFCTDDLGKYDSHTCREYHINGRHIHFMDVNRYSKNIIVIQFPQGTGGTFLSSCLNLSNDVAKYISKDSKKSYIEQTLSRSKTESRHFDQVNFSFCWEINDVEKSINDDEFTFILTHHYNQEHIHGCTPTKKLINFFHNAKVLKFENWIPFYVIRKYFPSISFDDYCRLDSEKKKKLISYNSKNDTSLHRHSSDVYENTPDYTWDTSNFFNKNHFLDGIEELYNNIGLSDFDRELIDWYYDEWNIVMRNWRRHK